MTSLVIASVPFELQPPSETTSAIFQNLSIAAPAERKALLSTLSEDAPEEFVRQMRTILRRLMVVDHRAPTSFSELLRSMSDALANFEQHLAKMGEHKPIIADTIQWLLSVQGGSTHSARETNIRWYCCTLLLTLLQSAITLKLALPKRIENELARSFISHVKDRSSDVRLVALEGLATMTSRVPGVIPVATERAGLDCDASARSAAVRLLVRNSSTVPKLVVDRISLDRASRVRRVLLEALEQKVSEGKEMDEWVKACPWIALRALRDRSPTVHAVAMKCLLACTQQGWSDALQSDLHMFESFVIRLSKALASFLEKHASKALLIRQLSPQSAISKLHSKKRKPVQSGSSSDDLSKDNLVAALLARIATTSVAYTGRDFEALSLSTADLLVPTLMELLDDSNSFELRQVLHTMLYCEMPECNAALSDIAHAAGAVLQRAPLLEAKMKLSQGFFPMSRLGSWVEKSPSLLELGMSLLRRVTCHIACSDFSARAEAWFSRAASTALKSVKQMLVTLEGNVSLIEDEINAGRIDPEEAHENPKKKARLRPSFKQLDKKLAEAREACSDQHLRTMLCAVAWLQQSQAPLANDALQRATLHGLFRPTLDSADAGEMARVAAILGMATYASKAKDQALLHWDFFIKLLKPQMDKIAASFAKGAELAHQDLHVPIRLVEIALLFLSDVLLLYIKDDDGTKIAQLFEVVATTLQCLDKVCRSSEGSLPSALVHLRAVLCDRSCCLVAMGRVSMGGSAALWVLGYLLADACGAHSLKQSSSSADISRVDAKAYTALSFPSELNSLDHEMHTSQVELEAAMRGRLLRFFASLPVLSLAHAELLVQAAEAFFAIRFWLSLCESLPDEKESIQSSRRLASLARAARLVCAQLMRLPESMGRSALQMRVVQAVAASLLVAPRPEIYSVALQDALAAAVISSVRSSSISQWADACRAGQAKVTEILALFLHGWLPSTRSKDNDHLLEELRAEPNTDCTQEVAWAWAQHALDWAADLRHNLVLLGLLGPNQHGEEQRFRFPTQKAPTHSRIKDSLPKTGSSTSKHIEELGSPDERWGIVSGIGEQIELSLDKEKTLGRNSGCDIVIPAPEVSGKHCSVLLEKQGAKLIDLGGRNGTYLNGSLVGRSSCMELKDGDTFTLASPTGQQFSFCKFGAKDHGENRAKDRAEDGGEIAEDDADDYAQASGDLDCGAREGADLLAALNPQSSPPVPALPRPAKRRRIMQGPDNSDPRLVDISSRLAHRLPCDGIFTIGRRSDCEYTIESAEISSRHCILFCQDGHVEIVDMSTNGVFINGKRLHDSGRQGRDATASAEHGRQHLRHGDRIAFARHDGPELTFCGKGRAWRAFLHEGGS